MSIIKWCNDNNGFLTAILSLISLILSITAIVVSISTARLPYKKKLLLDSSILLGVSRMPIRGIETNLVGLSATATNIGNRAISLTYLGFAIKKGSKFSTMYPIDRPFDSRETLGPSEMFDIKFSKGEILKELSKEDSKTRLYTYALDTEGTAYKKKVGTIGKVISSLKE